MKWSDGQANYDMALERTGYHRDAAPVRFAFLVGIAVFFAIAAFWYLVPLPWIPLFVKTFVALGLAVLSSILVAVYFARSHAAAARAHAAGVLEAKEAERSRQLDEMRARNSRVPKVAQGAGPEAGDSGVPRVEK